MAAIGIDLGTTNSLVAVFRDDKPMVIPNSLGAPLTPSTVSIEKDGTILVGQAAKERLLTHPDQSMASFKRFMGTNHLAKLGKREFRPEELSALVLRSLKADAEAFLGEPISGAVISVPAYFNDQQRKATIDAGRLAGLTVERVVNEPTAAALAYGLGEVQEGNYLVFDLGGGTFDVSILDKYADVMEIRATTGDTRLGGDDFTDVIEKLIASRLKINLGQLKPGEVALIKKQAEDVKAALTSSNEVTCRMNLGSQAMETSISRQEFETACATLLQRLRLPTERAVRDANITANGFDAIVMVGGATRMPMIRSLVAKMFGRLPLITIDPDKTVALGAAVQAALIQRHGALRDVVMTDVCPYTLGVATVDDADDPYARLSVQAVIERNAVVPISRNLSVSTIRDKQKVLQVSVYQGENLRPENNVLLGSIDVSVPARKRGEESVDIRFTYDINGVLQVQATAISTGKTYEKIFQNTNGLPEDEIRRRFKELEALKLHPRERMENKALVARAERIYEECRGAERDEIKALIINFEQQISDQKLRDPEGCRKHFSKLLDSFERNPLGTS
jgi:molecular chaperone HscC